MSEEGTVKHLREFDAGLPTDGGERPFRVIVADRNTDDLPQDPSPLDDELSMAEIEAAYLQALETADAVEASLPQGFSVADDLEAESENARILQRSAPVAARPLTEHLETDAAAETSLSPLEILEAVLFVGGDGVTTRKICDLLGGSFSHEAVDEFLGILNARYAAEGRPYELSLGEGGYRLTLKPEYEMIRRKVYNQGPKEVKLTQDALEVLAFVAYQQPVTREQVEATEKQQVPAMLRQLLRRQLIALSRDNGHESYRTTPRFLELFGLASLDDLPMAVDFSFK